MALLGRTAEQEALSRLLASARLGRGGALVVVGEPGVGKTALLEDAVAAPVAAAPLRTLSATGTEAEQDLPFAALHAALRPTLPLLGSLPGPQADALGAALSLRPGRGRDRFAIGAATLSLLSRYAEDGPVVLVLDDLHWVDPPSAEALGFAAHRLGDDPVAVLAAARADGVPAAFGAAPRVELGGLEPGAAARLLTDAYPGLGGPAVERLCRATGGNPLALLELGRDPGAVQDDVTGLPPTLPARLQSALARRLDPLDDDERAVALVAAVVGDDLRLARAVCSALGLDPASLSRVAAVGLVRLGHDRLVLRHPLLRSAVYGWATPELRRRVHLAAAAALTAPADADRRAWHLAAGTERLDEAVALELEGVAGRAGARSAFTVGSTALERAARLSPDAAAARGRLVAAARAAWAGGQRERALRLLDEAEPTGAPPTADAAELRATVAVRSGSLREGVELLEDAAALAAPHEAAVLLADACHACMYLADGAALRRVRDRLASLLDAVDAPLARAVGLAACGAAGVLLGEQTADLLREALPLLVTHDPLSLPAAVPWLGLAPLFLRDVEAGADLRELVRRARTQVGLGLLPNLLFHLARDEATATRWDRAAANYEEAVALARETGQGTELAVSLAGLACLDARAGRAEDCRAHAADALGRCRERALRFGEIWCELALGELALSEGDAAAAAQRLEALDRRLDRLGVADPDLHPGPDLVDALCRVGRAAEAAGAAAGFARLAHATGRPWARARADRALALVAGDEADADALFRSALTHHDRTRDVFETARTRLARGMRLRRAGRRREAREELRAALTVLDDLGAALWAATARAELGATGERVPPRAPLGPSSLTPQELQVCLLLAEGRTTREAAAGLFLSPKTVEYHLRKAYTKLDIHSRGELAEVMGTLDDQVE